MYFIRPACPVTKEFLASQTDVVLSLTAKQHLGEEIKSVLVLENKVDELF